MRNAVGRSGATHCAACMWGTSVLQPRSLCLALAMQMHIPFLFGFLLVPLPEFPGNNAVGETE